MSRSSAPQVLQGPGAERDTASLGAPIAAAPIPAPRTAVTAAALATAAAKADARVKAPEAAPAEPAPATAASAEGRRGGRRLPHPPGRRVHLWFAALIVGALLAAGPGIFRTPEPLTGTASEYGLGLSADLPVGGLEDAGVRRSITEAEAQLRLGELAASRAAREPKTVVPLADYRLTTCFCMRWGQMHPGWDMAAPLGTPIYSATDGVVIAAGRASGFGNAVYIQDADGNVHIYGHMRYYDVAAGDVVRAGDQIAKVGNEGFSTGPHVHWQIQRGGRDGRPIDPQKWLTERGVDI